LIKLDKFKVPLNNLTLSEDNPWTSEKARQAH